MLTFYLIGTATNACVYTQTHITHTIIEHSSGRTEIFCSVTGYIRIIARTDFGNVHRILPTLLLT